jgi:hypothetical protein
VVPNELGQPNITEVPTVVPTSSPGVLTPDLAKVIEAWPTMPAVAKAGVLAMIHAAKGGQIEEQSHLRTSW